MGKVTTEQGYRDSGGAVLTGAARGRIAERQPRIAALYARGGLSLVGLPAVAIVGSREPTQTGLEMAAEIARAVVATGRAVISGGAPGNDRAAHEAAVSAGGCTVAVLG